MFEDKNKRIQQRNSQRKGKKPSNFLYFFKINLKLLDGFFRAKNNQNNVNQTTAFLYRFDEDRWKNVSILNAVSSAIGKTG